MKQHKVISTQEGQRLDHFLQTILESHSRSFITQNIKKGTILVNQKQVKSGYMLKVNDVIDIDDFKEVALDLNPVNLNLDIIYEDNDLLVINKPSGLVVHPAQSVSEPTLVHGLLHEASSLSSINGIIRPGIVHRIDKDTSGLLVVAKNDLTHQKLSEDLKEHLIKRTYIALVYGHLKSTEGKIDAPIKRHPKNRLKMAVDATGKHAVTHFKVIKVYEKYSLIECQLETGRTHQIRVHLAFIGHPILGDPLYGPKPVFGDFGQFLHAKMLEFNHPIKKEAMVFLAPLPLAFQNLLNQLEE